MVPSQLELLAISTQAAQLFYMLPFWLKLLTAVLHIVFCIFPSQPKHSIDVLFVAILAQAVRAALHPANVE